MIKFIITNILTLITLICFSQGKDYVISKEFIAWQKQQFDKKRDYRDQHYESVNRTISITAHILVLGKDTIVTQKLLESKVAAANELYKETGLSFSICEFKYYQGHAWDTIWMYAPYENFEELRRKHYNPYTINMYVTRVLFDDEGKEAAGIAPMPDGIDTSFINPPIPDQRGSDLRHKDWLLLSTKNLPFLDKVIAHELGHYFGLFHPHETDYFGPEYAEDRTNCSTTGDLMCDTPAEPDLTDLVDRNCHYIVNEQYDVPLTDPSGTVFMPSVTNIMSYIPPDCMQAFTQQQIERMIKIYYHFRTYLR